MAVPVPVDDPSDPRLADFRHLRDPDRRQRIEADAGILIAESAPVVRRLLSSPYPVRSVVVRSDRLGTVADLTAAPDLPVHVVSPATMARVSGFDVHRGVLASATRLPAPPLDELLARVRRLVVLEDVNDHENLGAVFRSAAALGAHAVVLSSGCADPLYRRAVRVSMGAVLHLPFARLPRDAGLVETLRRHRFECWALTPADDAEPLPSGPPAHRRLALLAGAEGDGLSPAVLAAADHRVRIPMTDRVDSLNVAMAVTVACHTLFGPAQD